MNRMKMWAGSEKSLGRKSGSKRGFVRRLAWALPIVAAMGITWGFTGSAFGAYSAFLLYPMNAPAGVNSFSVSSSSKAAAAGVPSGGYVVGSGSGSGTGGNTQAILWDGGGNPINLNPTNLLGSNSISSSTAYGTGQGQQVGAASGSGTGGPDHAILWTGTSAASAVDLHPSSGFLSTDAYATSGTQQIGQGVSSGAGNPTHAILWNNGDPNQANDLNPTNLSGYTASSGQGVKGHYAVGSAGGTTTSGNNHAMLWTGGTTPATDANTSVDLNPTNISGYSVSAALGTSSDGSQQVGSGSGLATGNKSHAMLWAVSASTAVDMGLGQTATILGASSTSIANDTNGVNQVGYGFGSNTGNKNHALLWAGLASSTIDLNSLLPAGYSSIADTIDSAGDVFGTATDSTGRQFAVEWSTAASVPEPASLSLLAIGGASLMQRRRRTAAKI